MLLQSCTCCIEYTACALASRVLLCFANPSVGMRMTCEVLYNMDPRLRRADWCRATCTSCTALGYRTSAVLVWEKDWSWEREVRVGKARHGQWRDCIQAQVLSETLISHLSLPLRLSPGHLQTDVTVLGCGKHGDRGPERNPSRGGSTKAD